VFFLTFAGREQGKGGVHGGVVASTAASALAPRLLRGNTPRRTLESRLRSDISPPLLNGVEPPVEHLARLSRADTSSAQARGFEVAAGR
jgi:hypothetical protein